jgi:outer membrane protein assembly factor BamB
VLTLVGILGGLGVLSAELDAANWPRFRGPNGTGVAADKNIPVQFDQKHNLVWKAAIPGTGHGSPIVWQDRIFLQSSSPDHKERTLLCLSTDGKVLWTKSFPGDHPGKGKLNGKNSTASSTPATDGERVYSFFWDGQTIALYAHDFQGKQLWKRDLGGYTSQHGAGHSPMVWQDKVILNNDQDGTAVLQAFDAKSGKPVWEVKREAFRACYSTPFILERPNRLAELVVTSTTSLAGYNPDTGAELWKWHWSFDAMPLRTVASSVFADGILFANAGDGGGARHMVAVQLSDKDQPTLLWENKKSLPYVPCMLVHDGHLYWVNDRGIAGCTEAKTGKEVWTERLADSGVHSSPILIDGKVYIGSEAGDVYVFAAEPAFKLLAKNSLGEMIAATPAVANGRLYIRTTRNLYCFGK